MMSTVNRRVSLLAQKNLPSFAFVRETYLDRRAARSRCHEAGRAHPFLRRGLSTRWPPLDTEDRPGVYMTALAAGNDLELVGELKFVQLARQPAHPHAGHRTPRATSWCTRSKPRRSCSIARRWWWTRSHLPSLPDAGTARALIAMIAHSGLMPQVGLAYGTRANEELARELGLPLLAKFRAAFERDNGEPLPPDRAPAAVQTPAAGVGRDIRASGWRSLPCIPTNRCGPASSCMPGRATSSSPTWSAPGAEVIADGSIHVYGARRRWPVRKATRRRASTARNSAELVSRSPASTASSRTSRPHLRGKPVQCGPGAGTGQLLARLGS